ncbi:MAG: deoxyguanosinetriphosphate triphosphohydrolase [Alphaproteobacteria bacterium]|nr:deoxyguanosinetriphosphate triphosphohydrolase [Alphaproteobacteria bacterium]
MTLALAPYASSPEKSRGRLHREPESPSRTPFQRDRDRIIHSAAFRRLQYKTQVFVYHEGDHYRTRLTHSLEVAQIARSLARALGLNEDLAEALALAHDLGHTPFGHAGEEALDAAMKDYGGFSHNDQTLRILTSLERRYAEFDGLNLTWETLEGTVKHNGPVRPPLSETIAAYNAQHDLELDTWPSAEAQVAALSDDIAYDNHDIDDGFRAGLFTLDDLRDVRLIGDALAEVRKSNRAIEDNRAIHEAVRRLIDRMVTDVVDETKRRIAQSGVASADAVRKSDAPLVAFSETVREREKGLRAFLFERMYRHYRVNRMSSKARRIVADLFRIFTREPELLPSEWRDEAMKRNARGRARLIADYIAGMTDRFALDEHRRLFDRDATT